jgi:alkylation response protein AidB-like acyl-CoA dehydrogenase
VTGVMDITEDIAQFRRLCRDFVAKEITPNHPRWEDEGIVPRDLWLKAGAAGLLGFNLPEQVGGCGVTDYRFNAAFVEELFAAGASGPGFILLNDVFVPYIAELATGEQLARWAPGLCSGELIGAIAMTEPGTGSDLQGIRTKATPHGDGWKVTGQKTFVSNGIHSDLVIVVARTDPDAGSRGFSLLVVERGMDGFTRGRNLDKVGVHAADTAELSFEEVYVPRSNLLGEVGQGFTYLMANLPQERLCIAVQAVASIEACLDMTLDYVRERTAFGTPIGSFQHNKFVMAEIATEAKIARLYVNWALEAHARGGLNAVDAAMLKWWATEKQVEITGRCLQLHGGYGYMREYPISRHWADARIQTIYGGTTEIMKEIIGRSLGL